jgi:hypothetical protein
MPETAYAVVHALAAFCVAALYASGRRESAPWTAFSCSESALLLCSKRADTGTCESHHQFDRLRRFYGCKSQADLRLDWVWCADPAAIAEAGDEAPAADLAG